LRRDGLACGRVDIELALDRQRAAAQRGIEAVGQVGLQRAHFHLAQIQLQAAGRDGRQHRTVHADHAALA
jgi:hypothetical protein